MNINNQIKSIIWLIPAIIAFCLALIPTLTYQWPLSWDIINHVQIAHVYAKYGFVLTNPLLLSDQTGHMSINYPPLFHFLIASLGILSKVDSFQIARFLQPFLTMFVVLSVSYVGRKFYGTIAGVSAGFLIIASLLLGNRLIFPLPENLALIFLPLAVYFYYYALKEKSYKYATLAGSLLILILLIHQLAPVVLFVIITAFTIVELVLYRNILAFKNYGAFLLLPIILLVIGIAGLSLLYPNNFMNIIHSGIQTATAFTTSPVNESIGLSSYGNLGALTLIFGLIGFIAAIIRRQKNDIFLLTWVIAIVLLINAHLIITNINVFAYRLLVYLLIPVSILGGFGLTQVYHKLKDYKHFSSKNFRTAFLISIFILATFDGVLTMENPLIAYNGIENQYGAFQIAPPTTSMIELAQWFNDHGDKSKSIMSNDYYSLIFVTAQTGMPLADGWNDYRYLNDTTSELFFTQEGIGYVVLDKRLSFPSNNGTFYETEYDTDMYNLYYYSGDIQSNLNKIIPSYMKVVYENKDFIICQVQ